MHIKREALKCKQNPLQKGLSYAENILRIAGTAKAIWDTGKELYSFGQKVAPYIESGVSLLM